MTTYKELDYIESTGTQWIDTGVYGNLNTKIEAKVFSQTVSNYCIAGDITTSTKAITMPFNLTRNGLYSRFGDKAIITGTEQQAGTYTFAVDKEGYYVDGTKIANFNTTTSFTTDETMMLFGFTGLGRNYLIGKMYYCKIWDNTTLVRDFIPVLDFNNIPAMYDKVNDVLYYNQGTGEFNYKLKGYYCEVEYLESTGTQYIDTGYIPTIETGSKGVVEFVSFPQNDTYFLGCRSDTGNTRFWIGQAHGSVQTTPLLRAAIGMFTVSTIETPIGDKKEFSFNYNGDHKAYWGSESYTITDYVSFTATKPLWVFAANNNGSIVAPSAVKIYSLQIYEGIDIVRDYIPVLDWNMVPCLYDKVTGTKVYNLGTGQFNYGVKETESSVQLRRKFNMLLASHKEQGYTPLKYLEGTGTGTYTSGQYIDTGLDYFADFEITAKQRESAGMKALGTTSYYCLERENATTKAWRFRNGESSFFTTSLLVTDLHTLKWKGGKVYGDGVELGSFAKTSNTGRMYLFAGSTPNAATRINRYPLQISSCRMWNPSTGELVRDYIPVLDKNGTPCMLDRVENKLYYNQGTGDFLYEEWDYTPVDYVESTGTQYIDTGYIPTANTSFDLFGVDMDYSSGTTRFGSRTGVTSENYCFTSIGAGDFRFTYGSGPNTQYIYSTHKLAKKVSFDATTKICTITFNDDTTESSPAFNTTPLTSAAQSIYLFAFNNNGSAVYGTSKQSGLKIYEDGVLVRDYIPVVDGDNKAGFYDKCLNIISYSLGSSDFVGHFIENGVDYKVVKNIIAEQVATSTSTRACPYISTGIYPATNKKTRLKCKASLSVATTSYEHYLGGTNAGSRFVLGQASGSSASKFYFGLGTRNYWTTQTVDTDTHIFGLDWATETCSIDDTTWQIPSAGTSESYKPFFINARNTAANANANRPGGGTSYWWKFWEGKKLVYNGIPVVRVRDNKVGLFETVNREFQTTAGTVEYTYTE